MTEPYISIVGSVILASQRGGNTAINAYVAELIVSLDTDMKAIAAGRVWFFSSVAFAEANRKNPALVGAIALTPKEKRIEARLRTEKNSKMESKDALLEKILNSSSVQMSFRLTPDIADYYLEEVRYEAKLIGIDMIYQGSYRFAITRSAVLLKAKQLIMGNYNQSLRGGMGGIDFDASLNVRIEFAGLFLPDGVMAYGVLDTDVRIRASAFIEIGFRKKIFGRKISWVKRFSANLSTSVRFYGKAALISKSNECGFDGHVEISVPICGHHLSLDAGLAYKPEIINEVITEVTRFEQDLNAIGQMDVHYVNSKKINLLSESLKIDNFLPALKDTSRTEIIEQWYHYTNEKTQANLLMPSISAPWFTPTYKGIDDLNYKFINVVTQFEIETEDGQIYILLPSYEKYEGYEQLLADKFEQQRALFLESASEPDSLDSNCLSLVQVYSDPRIDTRSREYLIDEDQLLPEHALSFEFKNIEELMDAKHGSLNRVELQNIKKLEEIKAKYARVKMHSHDNQEKEDETKQSRAALMKMLLDDLNNPLASGLFAENINLENNKIVGLIFNSAFIGNNKIKTVKLKRKQEDGSEIGVTVVLVNNPVSDVSKNNQSNIHKDRFSPDKIKVFDIRQKYYQSNKEHNLTTEGLSKIVVKLPIAFDHGYVKGDEFSDLGYFQIYRKLPGQDQAELIADRVYPNIKVFEDTMAKFDLQYLDTDKLYIDVCSFVGSNIGEMKTQAALLIINKNNITSYESICIKGIKEENHLKNYDNSDEKQFLLDFIDPLNMKNKTVKDLNGISATDDSYNTNFAKADNLTVCVNPQKHIIIDPFLYTDEYMVDKNNKIYIQKENKGQKILEETLIIPDFSEIEYSIKRVSQADNVKVLSDIKYDKPLRLHVSSTKESMDNLAIVFSVDDLLAMSKSDKKFQIIKIENNSFSVVPDNTKLQIWVKELPLQQSGYYGGEQESYLKAFSKKETHLDKMAADLSKESTEGKIRLSFEWSEDDHCYVFKNSSTIFRIGYGYQFYIQASSMKNLLAHKMQHFLVKQDPKDWHPDLKIRYVEQIEWINSESIKFLGHSDFFVNKYFDETEKKNYIDANFNCSDLLTGGVELYFVDSDNPGLISKQTIQVMEESLFKRSEKSFSAQAHWTQMATLDKSYYKVSVNLNSREEEIFTYYFNKGKAQILIDIRNVCIPAGSEQRFRFYLNTNSGHT